MASVLPRAPATAPGQGIQAHNAKPQVIRSRGRAVQIVFTQMSPADFLHHVYVSLLQHILLRLFPSITCIDLGPPIYQAPLTVAP
jgi:hypothetical protein